MTAQDLGEAVQKLIDRRMSHELTEEQFKGEMIKVVREHPPTEVLGVIERLKARLKKVRES